MLVMARAGLLASESVPPRWHASESVPPMWHAEPDAHAKLQNLDARMKEAWTVAAERRLNALDEKLAHAVALGRACAFASARAKERAFRRMRKACTVTKYAMAKLARDHRRAHVLASTLIAWINAATSRVVARDHAAAAHAHRAVKVRTRHVFGSACADSAVADIAGPRCAPCVAQAPTLHS